VRAGFTDDVFNGAFLVEHLDLDSLFCLVVLGLAFVTKIIRQMSVS
jgi:hypothetical protein